MITNKNQTCCFVGHRRLPKEKIKYIVKRLNQEIDKLIRQGVTDFISSGTLGFDQIAVSLIIAKREMGNNVRLIFALPYENQEEIWNTEQKRLYNSLLLEADEVIYVSEEYSIDCMKKCDRFMIDRSIYCICEQIYQMGGVVQTVRYAKEKGINVIDISS
ncbi:SLOG family protein [Anaerovorax odorimutans]|uniref:SLOG family protein n=1 Tax=Anaerovorax odorimutans TaxID=109327 RepID=UPI000407B5B9|nr:SLOG family protein [Anaerovorax odorimutans]